MQALPFPAARTQELRGRLWLPQSRRALVVPSLFAAIPTMEPCQGSLGSGEDRSPSIFFSFHVPEDFFPRCCYSWSSQISLLMNLRVLSNGNLSTWSF